MKNSIRLFHHTGVALALTLASPALAQTQANPPEAPQVVIEDWVSLSHSGLRFAVPPGLEIIDDTPEDHLLALSGEHAGFPLRVDAQYRTPSQLAALAARYGADPSDPAAFFSAYSGIEFIQVEGAENGGHIGTIDDLPVTLLHSAPETGHQMSVFVAHYPSGAQAWFGMMGGGHPPEAFAALEANLWQSLGFDLHAAPQDQAPETTPTEPEAATPDPQIEFLGGIVTFTPMDGDFLNRLNTDERRGRALFTHSEGAPSDLMIAAMAMRDTPEPTVSILSNVLTTVSAYQETTLNGLPVTQIDGFTSATPDGDAVEPSSPQPARFYLTHDCLPEAGPLALGLLMTPERMAALDGDLSPVTAQLTVTMPDGSAQCGPEFGMALQTWLNTAQAPANDGPGEAVLDLTETPPQSASEPPAETTPPSLTLIEGLVQIAPQEPYVIISEQVRTSRGRIILAGAEGETAHTLYAAQAYDEPTARVVRSLTQALPEIETISLGTLGDIPVWIFEGTVNFSPAREALPDGVVSHGRFLLTQTCGPDGAGPLGLGALTTEEHLAQMGGFDALFAGVNVTLPPDAAPCPAEFVAMINAIETPSETALEPAPQAQVTPPQAPTGKPSTVAAPDDADWERAQADGSIPAMLDFIRDWPNGRNVDAARETLMLQGITPPEYVPPAAADDPDGVAWLEAQSLASPEAFWTYLKAQPNGAMRLVAQDWLEMLLRVQRGDYSIEPAPVLPTKHG